MDNCLNALHNVLPHLLEAFHIIGIFYQRWANQFLIYVNNTSYVIELELCKLAVMSIVSCVNLAVLACFYFFNNFIFAALRIPLS